MWTQLDTQANQWLCVVLYSSNEPCELSQWLCRDDSIIIIVGLITVTIITTKKQQHPRQ